MRGNLYQLADMIRKDEGLVKELLPSLQESVSIEQSEYEISYIGGDHNKSSDKN